MSITVSQPGKRYAIFDLDLELVFIPTVILRRCYNIENNYTHEKITH